MKYLSNYYYKIPDKGNFGSSRGTVAHLIFELLGSPKRKGMIASIVKKDSCKPFPSLWRLIKTYANQNGVGDRENLDLIDFFIVTGLIWDKTPDGMTETLIEKEFNFEVIKDEVKYRLRGFIDKVYLCEVQGVKYIYVNDFKGSKAKFKKDKILNSIQSMIYQLVAHYLFPEYKLVSFDFIFLKFRDDAIQSSIVCSKETLEGFEVFLTSIQTDLERITVENAGDNIAYLNPSKKALCGTGAKGFKADGSPIWICPAREPMDYWVELDEAKQIKKSYSSEPVGVKTEKRFYSGCCYFFDNNGKKRSLSFQ